MDRFMKDEYLQEAYSYESAKIPPFFRIRERSEEIAGKTIVISIITATLSAAYAHAARLGNEVIRNLLGFNLRGVESQTLSLFIFGMMMAVIMMVLLWCNIANRYERKAFEKASRFARDAVAHDRVYSPYTTENAKYLNSLGPDPDQ